MPESSHDLLDTYLSTSHITVASFEPKTSTELLVVKCSDRDYRQAIEELLQPMENLGIDRIVEPGGPLLLLDGLQHPDSNHVLNRAEFLITNHGVHTLLLIGHSGCGAYKDKYPHIDLNALDEKIKQDLTELKEKLLKYFRDTRSISLRVYSAFIGPTEPDTFGRRRFFLEPV